MTPNYHPFSHKWNFYRGNFWCLIGVGIMLACGVGVRLFMVWPKLNPNAKPLPRIITFTVWAGCVHEPDRTFTEIIEWRDPRLHLYNFLGIQKTDTTLTPREWDRFSQAMDPQPGSDNFIGIKRQWRFAVPGRNQDFRDICPLCYEATDLYLLGKPPYKDPSEERGFSMFLFYAFKSTATFQPELIWLNNKNRIFISLSEDGSHGPYPILPFLAIGEQDSENLKLQFLRSPYGACAFMNQFAAPVESMNDAKLIKQTFERMMGWEFLDKSNDRLEELIKEGSTLQLGQKPSEPADLEMDVVEDASGWMFSGPLQISGGPHWSHEKIYHRCALRVNRNGAISFQHIQELVEQYPGYQ